LVPLVLRNLSGSDRIILGHRILNTAIREGAGTSAERKRKPGRWYLPGVLYDGILERPLSGIRRAVRDIVAGEDFFPLLDICCGPGAQLAGLADLGRPIFGLDLNSKMMRYAAARRPGIPFVVADAARLPFPPATFQAVIISFALHEKEPALRRSLLDAAREVLRPGGCLVAVDFERPWDRKSRMARLYTGVIERAAGREHFRRNREFFRRGGLRQILAETGFAEFRRHDIPAGTCAIVLAIPQKNVLHQKPQFQYGKGADPLI
jgi:ubiquinone/menaquinone biosynthesis C-methylase UbiE